MDDCTPVELLIARRSFLGRTGAGLGSLALATLLTPKPSPAPPTPVDRWTGAVDPLDFAPKAKRVIFLYMSGGPSHLETFDHKPQLARHDSRRLTRIAGLA